MANKKSAPPCFLKNGASSTRTRAGFCEGPCFAPGNRRPITAGGIFTGFRLVRSGISRFYARMTREPANLPRPALLWLPLILVTAGLAFRVMKLDMGAADRWPNIAPWMALAFTGAIVLPRVIAWWVWPLALVTVDLVAQGGAAMRYLPETWPVYACLAVAAVLGGRMRGHVGWAGALGGVIACSLGFYLITNTASWLTSPAYAKDFSGWIQALTTGTPGYPPTILFLRNSLLSDAGFSVLLLAAYNAEAFFRNLARIPVLGARQAAMA